MRSTLRQLCTWHVALRVLLVAFVNAGVVPAKAQSISASTVLSFGRFVPGSGGTVVVSTSGLRSATGGIILINSGPGAASQSTVSGTEGSTYSVTLPPDGVIFLTDSNSNTMAVNGFVSNPAATSNSTGILLAGSQTLYIGATLSAANNQPAGTYSGTFDVTVSYP